MTLYVIIATALLGCFAEIFLDAVFIRTGNKIRVNGYIFHPQYYYTFEVQELLPYVKAQYIVQEGDYIIGHYTLESEDSVMTTVDYSGEPLHGFKAVLSGSEIHASLAAVLAKAMSFGPPADAPVNKKSIPVYQVPVLNVSNVKPVSQGKTSKNYWIPAAQHRIPTGYVPIKHKPDIMIPK